MADCKYFLPFWRLPFHFVDAFPCCAEAFELDVAHLFIFAFVAVVLRDLHQPLIFAPDQTKPGAGQSSSLTSEESVGSGSSTGPRLGFVICLEVVFSQLDQFLR